MNLGDIITLDRHKPLVEELKRLYEDVYVLDKHDRFNRIGEILEELTNYYGISILIDLNQTEELSSLINFRKEDTDND